MISTASSESSSRTASAIWTFGIDSRISLRTVSSTSVSATQSKSLPMRRTSWSRSSASSAWRTLPRSASWRGSASSRSAAPSCRSMASETRSTNSARSSPSSSRIGLPPSGSVRVVGCSSTANPSRDAPPVQDRLARGVFKEKAGGMENAGRKLPTATVRPRRPAKPKLREEVRLRSCRNFGVTASAAFRSVGWCGREDSNLHGLPHSDLNAARLPVPPRPLELAPSRPAGGHVANATLPHKGAGQARRSEDALQARPNALRSSSLAFSRISRRAGERFLPARLISKVSIDIADW